MDWDKLRVFRVVAEMGSMNAAASRLGESSPTISRKIDELERSLNSALLTRSTRGVELTEAGKAVVRYADAMADAAEAIHTEVSDTNQPAEGAIRLVTSDGLGAHWIAPRLPRFHLENPKIQLQLTISDDVPDFFDGGADIAVQFTEPKQQDLISRKLGVLHYMCFASREYLDTYGEPASMFEFNNHRCIFHTGYVQQIERWAPKSNEFRKLLEFALTTNSGAVMMAVCSGGGGIAALPSYVTSLNPDLVALDMGEVAPVRFWLTYTERTRRLPRGQVVIDWLRSIFDPRQTVWFRDKFVHPNKLTEEEQAVLDGNRLSEMNAPASQEF